MWWPCDDHVILASQFMVNWDFQGIWSDQHGNVDKTLNDKTGSLGWPRSRGFLLWVARGIMVKQHRMVRPRPFVCLHGFVQTGVYNKKLPLKWEKQCYRPLHFGVLSTCWKKSRLLFLGGYHHFYLSCVFFVVWARILLCCLRHCLRNAYVATMGAYAAHPCEGVPTQAQRPCKATPQCTFLPTPSHFRLLLEGWKRNFCLCGHSPINIFVKWGMPCSTLQGHQSAGFNAHAATCKAWQTSCSHTLQRHQHPGSKAHTKHLADGSYKTSYRVLCGIDVFFDSQAYFHVFFDCAIAVVTGTIAVVTAKLRSGFVGVVMEAVSARITVARWR